MSVGAAAVRRGCGVRQQGGAYAETGLSSNGLPLEAFLIDPPIRVDAEAIGLTAVGVKLMARADGSATDVWDIVGTEHYHNVADFLEEVRRFGMSRRLPATLDFGRLGPGSRHVVLHARGLLANWRDLAPERAQECPRVAANRSLIVRGATQETADRYCPVPPTHELPFPEHQTMCCGLWWDDVAGGAPAEGRADRLTSRSMPSFTYAARRIAPDVARDYRLAIVASLPITRIAVIRADDGRHEPVVTAAAKSALPVALEDA